MCGLITKISISPCRSILVVTSLNTERVDEKKQGDPFAFHKIFFLKMLKEHKAVILFRNMPGHGWPDEISEYPTIFRAQHSAHLQSSAFAEKARRPGKCS